MKLSWSYKAALLNRWAVRVFQVGGPVANLVGRELIQNRNKKMNNKGN